MAKAGTQEADDVVQAVAKADSQAVDDVARTAAKTRKHLARNYVRFLLKKKNCGKM